MRRSSATAPPADPRLKTLLPDPAAAARAWHAKHGAIQINHMVVVKDSLSKPNPQAVREIYRLLVESKQAAGLPKPGELDLNPFGVEANRRNLDVAIDCVYRQQLIPRRLYGGRALRRHDPHARELEKGNGMIIDCHGHYTTAPKALEDLAQAADRRRSSKPGHAPSKGALEDHRRRDPREPRKARSSSMQRERGTDLTIFSPRAVGMGHHIGNETHEPALVRALQRPDPPRLHALPGEFRRRLPAAADARACGPTNCIAELERCVKELGFIGCNLNPDPSGGYWTDPPLTDKWWYPLYEKMVELDVPAMVHVSASCNPSFHATGAHYINGDTTAFMQFLTSDLFKDFPTLKFIIPHGGGAVPYHWGRYRGLAQDMGRPPLKELLLNNVFFDTCVYHQPGIELLLKVIPADNILFASEMVGAVRGIDPETGHYYDDTKRYIDAIDWLSAADREKIYHGNVAKVYGRFAARAAKR